MKLANSLNKDKLVFTSPRPASEIFKYTFLNCKLLNYIFTKFSALFAFTVLIKLHGDLAYGFEH